MKWDVQTRLLIILSTSDGYIAARWKRAWPAVVRLKGSLFASRMNNLSDLKRIPAALWKLSAGSAGTGFIFLLLGLAATIMTAYTF